MLRPIWRAFCFSFFFYLLTPNKSERSYHIHFNDHFSANNFAIVKASAFAKILGFAACTDHIEQSLAYTLTQNVPSLSYTSKTYPFTILFFAAVLNSCIVSTSSEDKKFCFCFLTSPTKQQTHALLLFFLFSCKFPIDSCTIDVNAADSVLWLCVLRIFLAFGWVFNTEQIHQPTRTNASI